MLKRSRKCNLDDVLEKLMASAPLRTESDLIRQSETTQAISVSGEEPIRAVGSLFASDTIDQVVSFEEYLNCEFTVALLDHCHRAKKAALLENGE